MTRQKRKGKHTEAHVRVYAYEIRCPAWQTLGTDARALLVELRSLYQPSQANIVFLSVREAMRRLNIGQRRAEAAIAELLERGWITVHEKGGFNRKVRHATAYRLENEPNASPGAEASKAYMKWQPAPDHEKAR